MITIEENIPFKRMLSSKNKKKAAVIKNMKIGDSFKLSKDEYGRSKNDVQDMISVLH